MKGLMRKLGRLVDVFWKSVSAFRRFVVNILFLVLVIFFLSIFLFDRGREVPDGAALNLSLAGNIVEQKTESILSNQIWGDAAKEETLLKDILDVIDYAKDDQRIKALVLDLRKMGRAGPSKLQDIGAALNRFKSSGKLIVASGDYFNQRQYYLAAHADRVYISPMGGVMLYGFGLYRTYFKSALEKLRVNLHAFIVGTYKSALEPFLRDNMSKYAKEANLAWLNVLWDTYKRDIVAQRGLDPGSIDDYINNFPAHLAKVQGDMAILALNHGLVDGLKTRNEVREELIGLVGEDEDNGTFKQIEFDDYLSIIRPFLKKTRPNLPKVGIIVAKGIILDGTQPPGAIGGDSLADLIQQAREDDNIKSVVLRIDSGGGSTFASEIIRREVELTTMRGKPVIVSMGSIAASGGYWIASAADEIWASPTTITGSIGIFGAFATFENSLESLGIHSDGVGTTKLADAFDPSRPLNPLVKDAMQQIIEQGYRFFIQRIAEGRNMAPEEVEKIAQGRVWSGSTAVKLGLVDKLGSLQDAVRAAAKKAGLKDYEVSYIEKPLTYREKFIQGLNRFLFNLIKDSSLGKVYPTVRLLTHFGNELEQMMPLNDPHGLYAYCLTCNVR
ncbi:MAG: signal peptide peptidase SppA [Desulfobacterales bacterium]|nr:MAG: signal peptide peptidase SppA [Desulfobacterales bacterium]